MTTNLSVIGDLHGEIVRAAKKVQKIPNPVICVGDVGIGFPGHPCDLSSLGPDFRFIHGNHDNPDACSAYPGYLGRFGALPEHDAFYISGAFSVDSYSRRPFIDWFPNEQLSQDEREIAQQQYFDAAPSLVISHDCPRSLYPLMLKRCFGDTDRPIFENRTAFFLDLLYKIHPPKVWVFGHWHTHLDEVIGGTRFICLDCHSVHHLSTPVT